MFDIRAGLRLPDAMLPTRTSGEPLCIPTGNACQMGMGILLSRRRFLAALGVGIAGLAGCGDDTTTTDADSETPESGTAGGVETTATTRTESPASPTGTDDGESARTSTSDPTTKASAELDQREANVVGVDIESVDGDIRFSVSLNHDDDGEDGYANWWQVERLDGSRLGRRDLLHAHSNQPFTRSETIAVPEDVSCVVVRGHDRTHGYGGQAMIVNLETGATNAFDQGSEPATFDDTDCP